MFDGHNGFDVSNYAYLHLGTVLMQLLVDHLDPEQAPNFDLQKILVMAVDQLNHNIETRHPVFFLDYTPTITLFLV